MASLFVTPSSVITRLRVIRDQFKAADVNFPDFEIYGGAELELVKNSGNKTLPISLHVVASGGTGTIRTMAGGYPTDIVTNIEIILIIRTEDIRGQQADELGIGFKNFLVRALHTWEENDVPGQEPIRLTTDTAFGVDGHAVYVHSYTFVQLKPVTSDCLDDVTGDWESLDWFNHAQTSASFVTADGDTALQIWNAYPNIPPLSG